MIIVGLVALLMGVIFMGIGLSTGIWVVTFSISGACLLYALVKYASRNSGMSDGYKGEIRLAPSWAIKERVNNVRVVTNDRGYSKYYDETGKDITDLMSAGLITWNSMESYGGECEELPERLPSEEHVTRDGFHVAVGKEKPLDPDFSPSHILKE